MIGDLPAAPRALIIKPSSLGDIVHSLAFLDALKTHLPLSTVHWAVFKGLDGLIEGHPLIDKLIVIDKAALKRSPGSVIKTVSGLRKTMKASQYDITIDLQGLFRSGLLSWLSAAPVRLGFREAREGAPLFYTHKVEGGAGIHAVDRYLKVAAAMGCPVPETPRFPMVFDYLTPPFDEGEYAVIVPGARWKTKQWPAERFAKLSSMLPLKSVIVGSSGDGDLARKVVEGSEGKSHDMTGKTTLRQLAGLIKNAAYMVTNDTGPMHIAAAFGVPTFAIFGPTSPERTGPYGHNHTIIRSGLRCSPCYKRKCSPLECLESITPENVFDKINSRMK